MRTAIITGATGFIGSRLTWQLLLAGWRVHALGRAKGDRPYQGRVEAALDDIGGRPVDRNLLSGLHCHEAAICDPLLGAPKSLAEQLRGADAVLFHVAGDTRFTPPDPAAQRQINVGGSLNVVQSLHQFLAAVVHVSTAYVAGDRQGLVLEGDLDRGQRFCNCYEQSKLDAELALTHTCRELGLPLTIVRPAIITNDTATGRSSAFTHLNALVEVVSRVQKHYGIGDGEAVSESIRIPIAPDSRPNLAPVDPIVTSIIEIGTSPQSPGRTFHLCHPAPQPNSEVVSLIAEAFGVKDKLRLPFVSSVPENPTWTEEMILRSLKPYLPYLNEACTFDLTNTRSIIPDYDSRFAPMTLDYLHKVIEFQRHRGRKDHHE